MEICDVNRFYGHAHIIKEYCAYPHNEPIPLSIQHGVARNRLMLFHDHFEEPLFDYWIYSERNRNSSIKHLGISESNLHLLGSPFAYLTRLINFEETPIDKREGTIAFPEHSIPSNTIIGKYQKYAEELVSLPSEYHPITVSVHPHDIKLDNHQAFIDCGLEVITCGDASPLQSNFLHNFIHFIKDKRYVTSNTFNSACCYCMYLGLRLFILGSKSQYNSPSQKQDFRIDDADREDLKTICDRFSIEALPSYISNEKQRNFAQKNLGHDYLLSPSKLLDYLNDIRTSREYINKIKPLFDIYSQKIVKQLRPSGPMAPIQKHFNSKYSLDNSIKDSKVANSKINLPNVSMVCISSIKIPECIQALYISQIHFSFKEIILFTSDVVTDEYIKILPDLKIKNIPIINNTNDYSRFVMSELVDHVSSDYCLIIQDDGFILNENNWNPAFLDHDYIGAPWPATLNLANTDKSFEQDIAMKQNRVGNGGFSIRSRKLMETSALIDTNNLNLPTISEDLIICHFLYDWFINQGIKFAPLDLAVEFSFESKIEDYDNDIRKTLGFHGKHNLVEANTIISENMHSLQL